MEALFLKKNIFSRTHKPIKESAIEIEPIDRILENVPTSAHIYTLFVMGTVGFYVRKIILKKL